MLITKTRSFYPIWHLQHMQRLFRLWRSKVDLVLITFKHEFDCRWALPQKWNYLLLRVKWQQPRVILVLISAPQTENTIIHLCFSD